MTGGSMQQSDALRLTAELGDAIYDWQYGAGARQLLIGRLENIASVLTRDGVDWQEALDMPSPPWTVEDCFVELACTIGLLGHLERHGNSLRAKEEIRTAAWRMVFLCRALGMEPWEIIEGKK